MHCRRECASFFCQSYPQLNVNSDVQPVVYCGQLTYRTTLEPTQYTTFSAVAWISRPGTYALGAWLTETEVLETNTPNIEQVRHRYSQ